MVTKVIVRKSNRPMKKWMAEFENGRVVHFGATGYQDFTQHKNPERMRLYKIRHGGGRENHGKSGMYSAGFWSMWLLWNKPSLQASARDMERRFGLKISFSSGGASRKSSTKQRTSRKLRTRKMSGLTDRVQGLPVSSRIMAFLPPSDIRSMALAGRMERDTARYFIGSQPQSYFDMNMFRNMINFRGLLDLTTFDLASRYFALNDVNNTLRAEYIKIGPYVRLTSKDGKRLLPRSGVKTVHFQNVNVGRYDLDEAKAQSWWDNYFSEDFNVPIKNGELPDGLVTIIDLDRKLDIDSVPNTVKEITYVDGYVFDLNLEFLPETIETIKIPFGRFEDNRDYVGNLPADLKNKITVVLTTGFMTDYGDYEEDEQEYTLAEANDIITQREQDAAAFMNNMNGMFGF